MDSGWVTVNHKKKKEGSYPVRHFWNGYDPVSLKEKWFIELSNGKVVNDKDSLYEHYLKKYKIMYS